jgi:hypothetical protein
MNKAEREQKNLWRDRAKAAVKQAREEEAARPQGEREETPKRAFLLQRAGELLNLQSQGGLELETKKFWINKMIVGKTPAQNPDAPLIAPRYEAWPAEGEIPEWLRQRFADEHWLWNALAQPVQHAIRGIREELKEAVSAIYKQAEAEGLDTKNEQVSKKLAPKIKAAAKKVDFSPVKRIEQARRTVLKEADLIRHSKIAAPDAEMQRLGWNRANWNFAENVSRRPAWLQRVVETRLSAASKARQTRREDGAGEKWFQGYPKPDPDERSGEGGLDIYFNGQNLAWSSGEMKNSYLVITPPWNPPDHRGPRGGKYRAHREMRKVTLCEPESNGENHFSVNVLFHSVAAGARMKGYKLRANRDANGKLRWFFIPTFELPDSAGQEQEQRTFVGVDLGWRKSGDEQFAIAHSWDKAHEYRPWLGQIADNRWSKRYNIRQAKLPAAEQFSIRMTPEGLRDFASRKGALQRDFKMRMGELLQREKILPANWERVGKRGITRMMTQEKSLEFPRLQCLRDDYEAWAKRDRELSRIHRVAWQMVSENLDRQRREIARQILSGVTDIGVEALNVKQMAEAENEGATNWERHIENVRDRSRQLTGPAKFLSILVNTARKMGKRVHQIDSHYTSKSCSACGCINNLDSGETFTCAGCGRSWNRDENAARNLERLARECSDDDTNPVRCSHNGKSIPFHGITVPTPGKRMRKGDATGKALAKQAVAASIGTG